MSCANINGLLVWKEDDIQEEISFLPLPPLNTFNNWMSINTLNV